MKSKLFNIEGKVIVVTGAYGVLGAETCKYLAHEGAKVVVLGRRKDKVDELVAEIEKNGGIALGLESDVMNKANLEQNRKDILNAFGKIDVLINAAGGNMPGATIPDDKTIFDLDIDAFRSVVDLNFFGTVLPTVVFSKAMVDNKGGNIINFASASSIRPLTRVAGYGAAKAAVANFTKYMATEMAKKFGDNFRVNALVPGWFVTEQNRSLLTNPDGTYTQRGQSVINHTPFARFGEPEELLGTIHYLASDASKFVTGTMVIVDGGFDSFCI